MSMKMRFYCHPDDEDIARQAFGHLGDLWSDVDHPKRQVTVLYPDQRVPVADLEFGRLLRLRDTGAVTE